MLTIYEQIQEAVDLIEAKLSEGVTAREAARSAVCRYGASIAISLRSPGTALVST